MTNDNLKPFMQLMQLDLVRKFLAICKKLAVLVMDIYSEEILLCQSNRMSCGPYNN